VWNLKVSFSIIITTSKWSLVGWASRLRGLESRVVWRLNVWTREVAAGKNLNDGSFTLHSNLITTTWWARHVACKWKMRKNSVQAMKSHGGSRATAPLIHNFGTRWRWVVNLTIRVLYPGIHWVGSWVGPRARLNILQKKKLLSPPEFWLSCPAAEREEIYTKL